MIPNWLLGKSKSKLQEILGGGGGGGTTYTAGEGIDITDHEISVDPLLMNDIEQTALAIPTKAAKTQITNPNILHNPWFQVNQRGATTISSTGYFVDRWRVSTPSAGSSTITLNSDGTITIDNSLGEGNVYIVQRRTAKTISRVAGRKVTASVMLSDGTVLSGSGTYVGTETTDYYSDENIRLQSSPQSNGQFFALRVVTGKTVTIKALKLELGSISTLAMDTAPDMATELLKCQRYYQKVGTPDSGYPITVGRAHNTTQGRYLIHLDAQMRTNPSITCSDFSKVREACNHQQSTPSAFSAGVRSSYMAIYTTTTGLVTDELSGLLLNGEYFELDAEL